MWAERRQKAGIWSEGVYSNEGSWYSWRCRNWRSPIELPTCYLRLLRLLRSCGPASDRSRGTPPSLTKIHYSYGAQNPQNPQNHLNGPRILLRSDFYQILPTILCCCVTSAINSILVHSTAWDTYTLALCIYPPSILWIPDFRIRSSGNSTWLPASTVAQNQSNWTCRLLRDARKYLHEDNQACPYLQSHPDPLDQFISVVGSFVPSLSAVSESPLIQNPTTVTDNLPSPKYHHKMPPQRTIPPAKAIKTERTHEENQERCVFSLCTLSPTAANSSPVLISLPHDEATEVSRPELNLLVAHQRSTRSVLVGLYVSPSRM